MLSPETLSPDTTLGPDVGPPIGSTCATATKLTLVAGKASAVGSTTGFAVDHTQNCRREGDTLSRFVHGPTAYYRFTPTTNSWYRVRLTTTGFSAYGIVFTNPSCTATDIGKDCRSSGATGTMSDVSAGSTRSFYYKAKSASDVYVAVKGTTETEAGDFALEIEEITAPTNGSCAGARTIALTAGKGSATGDTWPTGTPDEFPALTCQDRDPEHHELRAQRHRRRRASLPVLGLDHRPDHPLEPLSFIGPLTLLLHNHISNVIVH
jgi:hypothetical protein